MALVDVITSLDIQPAVSPASFLLSLALSHSSKATHSSPLSAFLCLAAPALFPCTGFFWAFIRFSVSFLFDSLKRHENLFVAKLSYFTDVDKFLRHLQCVVVDFLFFHVFFLINQIFYGLRLSPISQMQLFFSVPVSCLAASAFFFFNCSGLFLWHAFIFLIFSYHLKDNFL